jgi:hypothetical protein
MNLSGIDEAHAPWRELFLPSAWSTGLLARPLVEGEPLEFPCGNSGTFDPEANQKSVQWAG